ncbi:MAG: hypothetical protein H7641_05500 [Candidatus Heimdallarchaeota archaeon]|nr:hypothetical protein [Candidatus Heimdallarchaeota archaeon]MCK4877017.1 hypothetical protein [Candidatus Heimdallarchaeota archaeon]
MLVEKNTKIIALFCICLILVSSKGTSSEVYFTEITVVGTTTVIDVSRGAFHQDFGNLIGNLTDAFNEVIIATETFELPERTDALFISQPDSGYTVQEMSIILEFLSKGNKTLFIGGDSDYGGYYQPIYVNDLLNFLGSKLRLDSTSISDPIINDGANWRVIAENYGNKTIGDILKQNCDAGISMHGPCAVIGYNDSTVVDLRNNTLEGVEVLLSYSANASSDDSDFSMTEFDLYSKDNLTAFENGNYPAVVCETFNIGENTSYIILAGEVIFAEYYKMYDQYTGFGEYNGGIHYGQMFVDNLVNFFLSNSTGIPFVEEYSKFHIEFLFSLIPAIIFLTLYLRKRKRSR